MRPKRGLCMRVAGCRYVAEEFRSRAHCSGHPHEEQVHRKRWRYLRASESGGQSAHVSKQCIPDAQHKRILATHFSKSFSERFRLAHSQHSIGCALTPWLPACLLQCVDLFRMQPALVCLQAGPHSL